MIARRLTLALVALLPACDILSPPDGELVLMVSTGYFDVLADTVRVTHGQGLHFRWDRQPSQTDYPADILPVLFTDRDPEVFQCVRGEPSGPDKYLWQNIPACDALHSPDSLMLLTEELHTVAKRILVCDQELNPQDLQGGFRECSAAAWYRVGEVGPMLDYRPVESPWIRAVGCGGWTWATFVKLDGWKRPWPDPFPGQDRVEIEVTC